MTLQIVAIYKEELRWENIYPLLNTENDRHIPEKGFSTPNPIKSLHFAFSLYIEAIYGEAF